jgi:uncharacterized membrane protein YhaH (DUF805 family)
MKWYLKALRHYADFSGRARPKEYWMFVLFNFIFDIVAVIIDRLVTEFSDKRMVFTVCQSMYTMAIFLPALAVTVRRLHDTGRNGWYTLLVFVPVLLVSLTLALTGTKGSTGNELLIIFSSLTFIAGVVWLLVLILLTGQQGDNRYGSDPKIIQPPYSEPARLRSASVTLIISASLILLNLIGNISNNFDYLYRNDIHAGFVVQIFSDLLQFISVALLMSIGIMIRPRMSDGAMPVDRSRQRIASPLIAFAAIGFVLSVWRLTGQIKWVQLGGAPIISLGNNMIFILYYLAILLFALSMLSFGRQWRRAACTTLAVASFIVIASSIYWNYINIDNMMRGNAMHSMLNYLTFFPVACILLSSVFSGSRKVSPDARFDNSGNPCVPPVYSSGSDEQEYVPDNTCALLYIYRRNSFFGMMIYYHLHLGDEMIFRVTNGSKAIVKVMTEGRNILWGKTERKGKLPVNIQFGREYYIRCRLKIGFFVGVPKIEIVDSKKGKSEYEAIRSTVNLKTVGKNSDGRPPLVGPASTASPNSLQTPPDKDSPSGSYYGLSVTSDNQLRYFGASEKIELEGNDMPDFIESLTDKAPDASYLVVPQKGLLIIPGDADSFMAMVFKSPLSGDTAVDYFKSMMAKGKQVEMIEQYAAFEIAAALPQTSLDESSPESPGAYSDRPDEVPPVAELSAREHTPQTAAAVPQTPFDEASESPDAPSGKPDEVPSVAELPAQEPAPQTAVAIPQAPANSKFKIQNSKFLKFSGRARRKEFWMFMLFNLIFAAAAAGLTFMGGIIYGLLYLLVMLIPSLAVTMRRLHDAGHSGWWILLNFVPVIGAVWVLILLLQKGQQGDNRYGRDPKKPSPDALNGKPDVRPATSGLPAGQEPSPVQNQSGIRENEPHYVLICKKCGERFHIPQNTALSSGRYVFVPEMCLMFCEYGDTFTVGLEMSGFFDVETVPSSGQILKASITDTMNMIHPHLIKHYSPLYLEIKQFPKATEHRYALEIPDVKHGGYVKYSDGGMDVVGNIDVSKAEIPPVPQNDSAASSDSSASQKEIYPLYTGTGVCDVCNRSLSNVKAYIVPNSVFYASPSWRAYFKRVSFGATDADIRRMQTNDRSQGSAVCENCIHMF